MSTGTYGDLQTRGFVVLPAFFTADEVEYHRADFARQIPGAITNYNHSAASEAANERCRERLQDTLARIRAETDLRVDFTWAGIYFATQHGINFPWHQDHEAYFSFQNHYDYLNFYIPIIKPRVDKSNLSVIPFDVLERECPAIHRKVVRHGSSRFVRLGRRGLAFLDDLGTVHYVPRDIEDLAVTPQLRVGDLLLMRGDVIHRTQDTETHRVALSFRASSSSVIVSRTRLAKGGPYKARMMARNAAASELMFRAFDHAGKNELTAQELLAAMREVRIERPMSPSEFRRYLIKQKLRAGVLVQYGPSVALSALANRIVALYERRRPAANG